MLHPLLAVSSVDPFRRWLSFHQALCKCELHKTGCILDRHFVHDGRPLVLHRAFAEIQAARDLLHRVLLANETYDVEFALCELWSIAAYPVYLDRKVTQGTHDEFIVIEIFVD